MGMTDQLILEKLKTQTLLIVSMSVRYNQNHDEKGRFASGDGSGDENTDSRFKEAKPKEFMKALDKAIDSQPPKKAWRVDNYSHSEEDYSKDKLFVTRGGSTVAVTPDGDIISLCRNKNDEETTGKDLMKFAVENGGNKLDSYSGNHEFYVDCGFEPVSWCEFDEEYAPPRWNEKRDKKEDILFYKYTGKQSNYSTAKLFTENVTRSKDYYSAQLFRDDSIK